MHVKLTTNLGSNEYPFAIHDPSKYAEGCTCEVDNDSGALMVKRGHAIEVTPQTRYSKAKATAADDVPDSPKKFDQNPHKEP